MSTNEEPKKIVVMKKSSIPKKTIVTQIPKPAEKPTMEAETPVSITTAGWKQRIEEKSGVVPKILKSKSETWDSKSKKIIGEKRKKGLVIFAFAMPKVGKTHFGLTAADFEGVEGSKRILPRGYPVFALDTENSVIDEAEVKFPQQLDDGKIIVENCFVENDITKECDPTKSLDKMEEWAYSLSGQEEGTLLIDTFTDYCEFAYYKLVDKVLGIGFTSDGKENKTPMPLQYKWRNKKVVSFMRTLRNLKCNVIYTAQGKNETIQTGAGGMDFQKTGQIIADALDKSAYWVDVICILDKEIDMEGKITRKLVVTDSRFESVNMNKSDYVLENDQITVANLINLFKDLI